MSIVFWCTIAIFPMRSIVLNAALLAALFSCSALAAEQARVDHEPVFGVVVDWNRLEPLPGKLYGEAPALERRILARVPVGLNELVFALGLLPITPDTDEPSPVLVYETDAGVLIKRLGALNIPLGASSGRLAHDYPEIDPRVVRQLLRTYVANLVTHFGSPAALRQALLENEFCAQSDPMALLELDRIGIGDACLAH